MCIYVYAYTFIHLGGSEGLGSKAIREPPIFMYIYMGASLVAQMIKNLPAKQETWLWSLGREDFLEKGMATHCSIFAWRIPWTGEPDGLQSMRLQTVRHNWVTNTSHFHIWILLSHMRELKSSICSNMDGLRRYRAQWNKTEKEKFYMISLICAI